MCTHSTLLTMGFKLSVEFFFVYLTCHDLKKCSPQLPFCLFLFVFIAVFLLCILKWCYLLHEHSLNCMFTIINCPSLICIVCFFVLNLISWSLLFVCLHLISMSLLYLLLATFPSNFIVNVFLECVMWLIYILFQVRYIFRYLISHLYQSESVFLLKRGVSHLHVLLNYFWT